MIFLAKRRAARRAWDFVQGEITHRFLTQHYGRGVSYREVRQAYGQEIGWAIPCHRNDVHRSWKRT